MEAWRERRCHNHPETDWRRFITSNGGVQIRRQCRTCGHLLGGPRKREPGDDQLPLADAEGEKTYEAARNAEYERILQKHARLQFERDNSWFRDYNAYLESDAWKEKRRLVFKRCSGICEGCGIAPADQVHHLTYAHAKREFLFELVAVCEACHTRLHDGDDGSAIDAQSDSSATDPTWNEHPCNGCRFTGEDKGQHSCFILDEPIAVALSDDGGCGPKRALFEELK
ncbi:HNH endonuclease [Rhizobium puerariae]|uniref:HNH endonuclease n=1 Tax=Rhizobium puerariae TaxID=1585791 RepID=A0ABV6AQ30_9HYPH